jgi:hypothetical protein
MFNPADVMIQDCINRLTRGYKSIYGNHHSQQIELMGQIATIALGAIAYTDAPYHDLEHTILVTLVGQEMLRGKHRLEGNVTPQDWLHFIVSLLCHDIGYIKGICQHDQIAERQFITGTRNEQCDLWVTLPAGATDASLTPYHVDRGQRFVDENLAGHPLLNLEQIKHNIELTRFPVPKSEAYQEPVLYPKLTRAADLIGQLSDPRYLQKIPALFYEFQETGANQHLGYRHPGDMRAGYPAFYRRVVYPLIEEAIAYLQATHQGRQTLNHLYANVAIAEQDCTYCAA